MQIKLKSSLINLFKHAENVYWIENQRIGIKYNIEFYVNGQDEFLQIRPERKPPHP